MKHTALALLAAGAALVISGCAEVEPLKAQTGGGAPRVNRLDNGAYTVRYDNGCIVTYNREGRRTGSQACRPGQVEQADLAVQRDAGSRGGGGMDVQREPNGAARVTFNDGCLVTYNRDGRRSGSRGCHPSQVERADKAIQVSSDDRGGGGLRIQRLDGGARRVVFNDGCAVTYNRKGDRSGSQGCTPNQVQRADRAIQRQG